MPSMKRCTKCRTLKAASPENFYREGKTGGYKPQCKDCIRKAREEKKGGSKGAENKGSGDKMTTVRCSCGHDYKYKVDRPSMLEWLKKQPCPPCVTKEKKKQQDNKTEKQRAEEAKKAAAEAKKRQEAERKAAEEAEKKRRAEEEARTDHSWVAAIMDMVPEGVLFHSVIVDVLRHLRLGHPVWLQGPPGTSKSTLAEQAARGTGADFYSLSCHELMTRSDLFGFTDANGNDHRTPLWDAFEKGGVLLLDEVDNGNPNLLAALNSALSNGHCVFGSGTTVQRHDDFRVIATANTAGLGPEHGFIGRNGVDLATRDRFVTVNVQIDDDLETALAALYMGEDISELVNEVMRENTKKRLEKRSRDKVQMTGNEVLAIVKKARAIVESRFHGVVVSPRVTIHAVAMIRDGFTPHEALAAKLPGLKPSELATVIQEAMQK